MKTLKELEAVITSTGNTVGELMNGKAIYLPDTFSLNAFKEEWEKASQNSDLEFDEWENIKF